jgi:superfamily II DNA or RNA helicase
MSAPTPKKYQTDAVNNALDIFRYAESQIQVATDDDSRRTASAFNGCVLLEAPTGAGKTLMAGLIAEAFARPDHPDNARIVWFWFTPFTNLVEQAKGALKRDFAGLRIRDLVSERVAYSTHPGDVTSGPVLTKAPVFTGIIRSQTADRRPDQELLRWPTYWTW